MGDITDLSEMNKSKLSDLIGKFEKLFKVKGYKPTSTFDSKVWFLQEDQSFQSLLHNQTPYSTPKPNKKIIDLIYELNTGNDIKNMKVPVDKFIYSLSKMLIDANISIQISDESINKNNSLEKISKINEILHLLNSRVQGKSKAEFISTFQASITSLHNLPSGPYKVNMMINSSFDKEDPSDLNESEKKNMVSSNPDSVYNLFKEKVLSTKSLITIPNDSHSVIFRSKAVNNMDGNYFDEYGFSILEKAGSNYLLDRRYSGSTFSNFKLCLNGKKGSYESHNEYLLHLVLSWIDELCDLNKELISKNLIIKVRSPNDEKDEGRVVGVQFDFELDNLTRVGILNRIKELISIPVDTKVKNQLLIEEILNDNFPELKDSIKSILEKNEEQRDSCCTCIIF